MRHTVMLSVVVLLLGALTSTVSAAADGLRTGVDDPTREALRGRMMLGTSTTLRTNAFADDGMKINSLGVMGDYYLSRPLLGASGGLRATSGVLFGQRSSLWSSPVAGSMFSIDRRASIPDGSADTTTPYLGVGYTELSVKGGWGVSADFGLMAVDPRFNVRLGRGFNGGQNLDDSVRELRFSPVLQVGVSYAF